jgi:GNAT superfamily N-acetyltransferase
MESSPAAFAIRPPTAAERRACRMLLPRATGAWQRSRLFVAVAGEPPRVVGAAALGLDRRLETHRAWQVDLRVIVTHRGRGIGRALTEHAAALAARHGAPALSAWEWVEPDSDAARAWAALGFSPAQRKLEYEADIAAASSTLLPLYEQVRAENWIPPSARIIPLAEADHGAVADLHVQYLGGSRRLLMPLLNGSAPDRYDPKYSRVMLLDGRVVGFSLGRLHADRVCEVDAHVLHPSVRMGWANLWLKMEAAERLLDDGIRTMRYFSLQQHTDTQRISRQAGCRLVRTLVQMRREVGPLVTVQVPPAQPPPGAPGAAGG